MKPKSPDPAIAPTQAQVYAALAVNPLAGLAPRELMARLGLSYHSVCNALQRLRMNGRVENDRARGLWRPKTARGAASGPDPWRSTPVAKPEKPGKPLEKGLTPEDLEWMRAQQARAAARAARPNPWRSSNAA